VKREPVPHHIYCKRYFSNISQEHDIEEILQRLKQLEENQDQIIEILWDELKIQVRFIKSEEL